MVFKRWNDLVKNHGMVAAAVLYLVSFVAFGGTLANGFVQDDVTQLLMNPFVRNPHLWRAIFTGSVWSFLGGGAGATFYRPLHIFSYWLICRFAGFNPGVYHLIQLAVHAACAWLVFLIARKLLQDELAAFAGALLWTLHPLHVEPVAWIAGLPDVACSFFYLSALWLFLRAEETPTRPRLWHCIAAVTYFPALFFKEMALSFPLLLLTYWFSRGLKELRPVKALYWIPYLSAALGYVGIRIALLGRFSNSSHLWGIQPRLLQAAIGLLGQHTRLFLWPNPLTVFRTFDIASSFTSPWPWITLAALLAALGIRKREPVLSFLLIWWPVTLVPVLNIRFLSSPLVADRHSYLPSVGLCLAIAYLAFLWLPRHVVSPRLPALVVPPVVLLMVLWAVQCIRGSTHWCNNEVLAAYALEQSPHTARLHFIEAQVLEYEHADLDGAEREIRLALELNRASPQPLNAVTYDAYVLLGTIATSRGRREEAIKFFEKATTIFDNLSDAYLYLGSLYLPQGDYARAAQYFSQAVNANRYDVNARFLLGTCWMKLGKYREAAEQFHAAREVDPSYWQAFDAEARARDASGDSATAARVRGLRPDPSSE